MPDCIFIRSDPSPTAVKEKATHHEPTTPGGTAWDIVKFAFDIEQVSAAVFWKQSQQVNSTAIRKSYFPFSYSRNVDYRAEKVARISEKNGEVLTIDPTNFQYETTKKRQFF